MLKKVKQPQLDVFVDPPPQPLGEIGRALWDGMLADRDLNERERQILFEACDAVQQAATLAKVIAEDGPVISSATGRKSEHPAIRPLLHFKALAVRCLALLKPHGPGSPGRPASRWYEPGDDD